MSLARQLLVLQLVGVLVLVGVGALLAYLGAVQAAHDQARDKVVAVAESIADAPDLRTALVAPRPSDILQPYAEQVRADTDVDFVTIMNPAGIRYTHPNQSLIGQRFVGNTAEALRGRVLTETYTGTLGPSVRAVVPVFGPDRAVLALVSAGITVSAISAELTRRLIPVALVAFAVALVGVGGSVLISGRLRRQTRGLAPDELSRVFASYEATLHAVREGLILVGADGRIALCNDGARALLGLPEEPVGRSVESLGLPPALSEALCSPASRTDEIHVTDTRVLVLNTAPVHADRSAPANVVTLRDHTDLQRLTGELNTSRGLANSLHAQAHEAANRLHTVVSLVEMGRPEEAVRFATEELDLAQRLTDQVVGAVREPVLAALLLGKAAEAAERGVELRLTPDSELDESGEVDPRGVVTILGNLVDNAIDAAILGAARARPRVIVTVRSDPDADGLVLRVLDSGPGVAEPDRDAVFRRGWSSKPAAGQMGRGLGLALVGQEARRLGGTVELGGGPGDGPGDGPGAGVSGAMFTVRLPLRHAPSQPDPR
jgi:two-component system, CitB family, sensor kinase